MTASLRFLHASVVLALALLFLLLVFVTQAASGQAARVTPADTRIPAAAPGAAVRPAATVAVTAGEKYRAGAMRRWFLGDLYRDLWTAAIRVPVLDLDTYAGGLTPLKAGGGMQTKSLRLTTKEGVEYVFRGVQKDHAWTVPEAFKGTTVERMSRDQVSANHPGGALIVAPLLEAAGVLHVTPLLVLMPRDAELGEFAKDFAGTLGWIEAYPHKPDSVDGFAGRSAIIDSDELLKKLNADPTERVDAPAYLAARLVDMLVGDWDRHPGQWKWAKVKHGGGAAWVAIPRDHDMAFVTYEGIVGRVGGMFYPFYHRFTGTSATASGLTWDSIEMDRRLLGGLGKPVWDSVVTALTHRITDAVIDAAMAGIPPEYQLGEPPMASVLRERRARLPALANSVYARFFAVADIHATDVADRATVTHVTGGFVDVRVESGNGPPLFVRRFDARETREIRLYLHGGDDTAFVAGNVARSIPVRIIGGNGTNALIDSATVGGRRNQAHLYNNGSVEDVRYGKDTLFNRQHWETAYGKLEPAARDRGQAMVVSGGFSAERGMGLTPRVGLTRYDYGFERRPYASRVGVEASYSLEVRGFRIVAAADRRFESSPVHLTATARMSRLELINYYGIGNATADSGSGNGYFAARQRQWMFHPTVAVALGTGSDLSLGPVLQYSTTDSTAHQFLSASAPYGFGKFGEAGLRLNLHHNLQDRESRPEHRFIVDVDGTFFPALWDVKEAFEVLSASFAGSVTLPVATRPMLVFRTGGKKVFGEYPFHEAAFIGGNHTARYMEGQRYAGDASLFGSTELRIPVTSISVLDVGIVGLADGGRVYVRGDSPGGWHTVVGGGLWFSLRGDHMKVVTVTMANERGRSGVHLRTGLGF